MAICEYCGREMLTSDGCNCDTIEIDGKLFRRIRVGDPGGMDEDAGPDYVCHDCNAKFGEYHHPGCDMEVCPVCGGQLAFGCECGRVRVLVDLPYFKEYLR